MTRQETIDRARALVDEEEADVLTASRARDCFDEALSWWCQKTHCLPVSITLDLVAGQQQYPFPSLWRGLVRCYEVVAGNTLTLGALTFTAVEGAAGDLEFSVGATGAATATALAAALSAHEGVADSYSVEARGAYVVVTALKGGLAEPVFTGTEDTLEVCESPLRPYRFDPIALYQQSPTDEGSPVECASTLEMEQDYGSGWRATDSNGDPSRWVQEGSQYVTLYPSPTGGSVTFYGAAEDYLLPDADTWDNLTLQVPDTHRRGLAYGTALAMCEVDLDNPTASERYGALGRKFEVWLKQAEGSGPRRPVQLGRRALRRGRVIAEIRGSG
jgi:hypothetical protein